MKYCNNEYHDISFEHFAFSFRENNSLRHKLIFNIKKKHFKSAKRNYIKRRIREMLRQYSISCYFDIFVCSLKSFDITKKNIIKDEFNKLLKYIS